MLESAAAAVRGRFPDARALSVSEVLHWPGVLADVTRILADSSISVDAMLQKGAGEGETATDLIILTHDCVESRMDAAIAQMQKLSTVLAPITRIRKEDLN